MANPKPKPAGLKLMEGRSPGRDSGGRAVKAPPAYVRLAPEPPEWLSREARAEWDRVTPELQRLELTKPIDRAALACYCEAWSRFVETQMLIKVHGIWTEGSMGQQVKSPLIAIAENASREIRSWCAEFGFTPSAENNMNVGRVPDGDDENPFGAPA
jgi:P27 family predicted phage terminase small subunit